MMEDRTILLREAAWDQERLKDLRLDDCISSVDKAKGPNPINFGSRIIRKIAPELEHRIKTVQLVSYLQKHEIATSAAEYQKLTKENATPIERSRCLRDILFAAGQTSHSQDLVKKFYLALLDSYENDSGLTSHRYLAVHHLRVEVLHAQGIDPQEDDKQQKDLAIIIRRLEPEIISGGDAFALRQRLGLENKGAAESTESVGHICEEWLKTSSCYSFADLVQALLCIRGLGRLVSKLVPLCFCNTPMIYTFIKSLRHQWKHFALHLGYTQREIDAIVEFCPADDRNCQIKLFLRIWWMPHCEMKTQEILEEVKRCANITDHSTYDDRAGSDQRADAQMVPVNLINVYHNYYSTLPPSAPSTAVGGMLPIEQQQGAAAFHPFINGAASTQPLPVAPHTVYRELPSEQTSSPPEHSLQPVVTETEGTQPPTTSQLITTEQPAEVQPLTPLSEDTRLLTQPSSLETEEQPKVVYCYTA